MPREASCATGRAACARCGGPSLRIIWDQPLCGNCTAAWHEAYKTQEPPSGIYQAGLVKLDPLSQEQRCAKFREETAQWVNAGRA